MPDVRELLRTRAYMFALLLAVVLLAANVIAQPSFGDPGNWPAELATLAPFALVAMASTPSIVSGGGGLDISVGPLTIVVNTILVSWFLPHGGLDSAWLAIPLLLLIGAGVGAINGVLVTVLRFQPVIATLCTFFVLSGVALKIAPAPETVKDVGWLSSLGDQVGPIPGALILMAIPVVIWLALSRTSYHRQLYAVGGNDATAYSSGVNVYATRIVAYGLGGLFAAVAGIALTALVLSTQATNVAAYTLIALAAVALGGTPLGGGRGGLLGSILGALCIYLLQTFLSAIDVSASWNQVVYGGLLVLGVVVGARLQARRPARARAVTA
jgi:ribose transport system permease protein